MEIKKIIDKNIKYIIAAFCAVELVLGIFIQIGKSSYTNEICFASVVLAFVFSIIFADKTLDSLTVCAALLFTVCADYCLVISPSEPRLLAMAFFNVVQLCYFARLLIWQSAKKKRIINLLARLCLFAVAIPVTFVVLGEDTDVLSIVSIIYFSNLVLNIVFSIFEYRRSKVFPIGLILFSLCDIFVGLGVLANDYLGAAPGTVLYELTHTEVNFIWLFYVPSQTLIALSNYKK